MWRQPNVLVEGTDSPLGYGAGLVIVLAVVIWMIAIVFNVGGLRGNYVERRAQRWPGRRRSDEILFVVVGSIMLLGSTVLAVVTALALIQSLSPGP